MHRRANSEVMEVLWVCSWMTRIRSNSALRTHNILKRRKQDRIAKVIEKLYKFAIRGGGSKDRSRDVVLRKKYQYVNRTCALHGQNSFPFLSVLGQ